MWRLCHNLSPVGDGGWVGEWRWRGTGDGRQSLEWKEKKVLDWWWKEEKLKEKRKIVMVVVEWKGKSTCDGWKTGVGMEEKKLTEKRKMVVVMVVLEERDEGLQDPILFGNSVHDYYLSTSLKMI